MELTRRNFVAGLGILAAGSTAGLVGCAPASSGNSADANASSGVAPGIAAEPASWDKEADVVVVGGGGAGLAAAVAAGQEGATVIVLEADTRTGGNTILSTGMMQCWGTDEQAEIGGITDDTLEKHVEYYMQASEGMADRESGHLHVHGGAERFAVHARPRNRVRCRFRQWPDPLR